MNANANRRYMRKEVYEAIEKYRDYFMEQDNERRRQLKKEAKDEENRNSESR